MHTYIRFVFYEVKKNLVTHVSMLYKYIQYPFQGCHWTKLHPTNKYCGFNGCGQNKTALRHTIGRTNLMPTTTPVHSSSKMARCHCFCFCAMSYYYLYVYNICQFIPLMDCGCLLRPLQLELGSFSVWKWSSQVQVALGKMADFGE